MVNLLGFGNAPIAFDASEVELELWKLPEGAIVSGTPETRGRVLMRQADGSRLGIWEITPGTVCDIEVEEIFVVLNGHATIGIEGADMLELSPGSICYLPAGTRTIWYIHETLRKVYRQFGIEAQ